MKIKKIFLIMCFTLMIIMVSSCANNSTTKTTSTKNDSASYFDDEAVKYQSSIVDMGGSTTLKLKENSDSITIENAKVRIVLGLNGSIQEYANKEARLYLNKDVSNAKAISVEYVDGNTTSEYESVSYYVEENTASKKEISFTYKFGSTYIHTYVLLEKDSSEVEFRLDISGNNINNSILDIEYPIIEGIDKLEVKEREYLLTPYTTGYLFKNPLDNFNDIYFGINKNLGLYPSGWYYPMQFSAYYSTGIGGFYWQTKDEGDSIKSFTFTGDDGKLRLSIWHYLDDIGKTNYTFEYPTIISNLVEGNMYEPINKYKDWALKQSWVKQGKISERSDVSKELFEDTTLCIFGYRSTTSTWTDMLNIYDMYSNVIKGKKLNISIYHNKTYMNLVKEYEDIYSCFEFNSLNPAGSQYDSAAMMKKDGTLPTFNIGDTPNYYICASDDSWTQARLKQDQNYVDTFNATALYFDVDFTTMHPIQCFNKEHSHGTRINVGKEFYEYYKAASDLMDENKTYSVGGEMISEQMLPYLDYYQARANGNLAAYMESDYIRPYIEMGVAKIVPLFTYVYHEYGALRLDGFLVPDEQLSNTFYHTAALTALDGGIVEFNYEYYYPLTTLPSTSDISLDMLEFVNKLGLARTTYGKNYLVYGDMLPSPNLGTGQSTYEFNNPNYTPRTCNNYLTLSGEDTLDDVVVSSFKYSNNIAIFLSNITSKDLDVAFVLHALRDFGITNGTIYMTSSLGDNKVKIGSLENGNSNIQINLKSHEVYMLEIIN